MSQTTTPPANITPIRPMAAPVAPQSWPAGPYPACPPDAFSAMARLMSCYEDVRLATEFLSKVMTDIIENNPAVTTAIVEAIQKAGSSLPTIGVTDGSNAQPGQVGEWVQLSQTFAIPTASQSIILPMGTLQPGDWDCTAFAFCNPWVGALYFYMSPGQAGFSNSMGSPAIGASGEAVNQVGSTARASISVPTLVSFSMNTNFDAPGSAASTGTLVFNARRMR